MLMAGVNWLWGRSQVNNLLVVLELTNQQTFRKLTVFGLFATLHEFNFSHNL